MPRKSTPIHLLALLVAFPLLLAMGGGGAAPVSDQIPRPQDNYSAALTDRQGVSVELEHLACDGETFFPLQRGAGILMVPFDKLERITLDENAGGRIPVRVLTRTGETLEGSIAGSLPLTGTTEFGTYRIPLGEVREISFP